MKHIRKAFAAAGMAAAIAVGGVMSASAAVDDWWPTQPALLAIDGDDSGYTISSPGDTGVGLANYQTTFDILTTEVKFTFDAWSTDPNATEMWAYVSFASTSDRPDMDDGEMLQPMETNEACGRIELILWHKPNNTFVLSLWNGGGEAAMMTLDNFDFTQSHALSFQEKFDGYYLCFDGAPLGAVNFNKFLEHHTGDNAGTTYLRVGGQQAFSFTNLTFGEITPTTTKPTTTGDPNTTTTIGRLGTTTTEGTTTTTTAQQSEPEADEGNTLPMPVIIGIVAGVVVVAAAVVVIVLVVKKRRPASK